MDSEMLKKFYFSGASKFSSFKQTADRPKQLSPAAAVEASQGGDTVLNESTITDTSAPTERQQLSTDVSAAVPQPSKLSTLRQLASKRGGKGTLTVAQPSTQTMPADAATAEYFEFLKQGQELQRFHQRIDDSLAQLFANRQEGQRQIGSLRAQSEGLLSGIEREHDTWRLRSKYNVNQLIKDCNLCLNPVELTEGTEPITVALEAMNAQLVSLSHKFGGTLPYAPYALFIDQAVRRIGSLETTLKDGNADVTSLCRLCDTMVIQLESLCALPTHEDDITPYEQEIESLMCAIDGMKRQREEATEEGEVHVAEKLCYDIIHTYEQVLEVLFKKMATIEGGILNTVTRKSVCEKYRAVPAEEFKRNQAKYHRLIEQCGQDITKMYALRKRIEEVEAETRGKVTEAQRSSEATLAANEKRQAEIFAEMERLERELEQLERERHKEIQKRIAEKDKDEHRRAEMTHFCATVDNHSVPLERTIKNMELLKHAASLLGEVVDTGFDTMLKDLEDKHKLYDQIKLTSHQEHLALFRHLLLELGDITRRKERMVEEVEGKIRQAHIQQELLAETYNPQAKKFGDIKKQLLQNRDDIEQDALELKKRAEKAMEDFSSTERVLHEAGINFIHPATDQAQRFSESRAKSLQLKAIAVGAPRGTQLFEETDDAMRGAVEERQQIDSFNRTSDDVLGTSVPQIRAATRMHQAK